MSSTSGFASSSAMRVSAHVRTRAFATCASATALDVGWGRLRPRALTQVQLLQQPGRIFGDVSLQELGVEERQHDGVWGAVATRHTGQGGQRAANHAGDAPLTDCRISRNLLGMTPLPSVAHTRRQRNARPRVRPLITRALCARRVESEWPRTQVHAAGTNPVEQHLDRNPVRRAACECTRPARCQP